MLEVGQTTPICRNRTEYLTSERDGLADVHLIHLTGITMTNDDNGKFRRPAE